MVILINFQIGNNGGVYYTLYTDYDYNKWSKELNYNTINVDKN